MPSSPTPTLYRGQLIIADDPRLAVLVPHAKKIQQDGKVYTVVPHQLDEYKVLRNLGYDVAPPILSDYDWPIVDGFQPFDAQRYTAALITCNDRCYVLNDLGTGKTRAALFAWDYLQQKHATRKLLVIAPLSTLRRTWQVEVMKTFRGRSVGILHGSAAKRQRVLAEDHDVYMINHDGLEVILDDLLKRPDIAMCVYDESTAVKNQKVDRWKVAKRLIDTMPRVVFMSGSPMPQAPTDAYGQIKLLTPWKLSGWSFSRFRDYTMRKVTNFKYVPRDDAAERVFAMMQPAVRFTRDQCLDLPPVQVVDYECKLSTEQKRIYDELRREFAAQVSSGEIKLSNAADKVNKLIQVALGCVYLADGGVQYLDAAPRLAVLDEIIEASASKVIVFTPYKHSLKMLHDHLVKTTTVAVVSGDVPPSERDRIFARFQTTPDPRVLAAHPQCMAHGLTLTEASTIVWWGVPPSAEIMEQANARITRPGQKLAQYIARIVATSIEVARYRDLDNRTDTAEAFLDLIQAQQLSDVI